MAATKRPVARGKSLFLGDEKLYVRGVTYGTFGPDEETDDFPNPRTVARDFARMAAIAVNAVRTYTVPPTWLLDLAPQPRPRAQGGRLAPAPRPAGRGGAPVGGARPLPGRRRGERVDPRAGP